MKFALPLSNGALTIRPARVEDAPALYEYRGRPETQTYISSTLHGIEDAEALLAERTSNPNVLMCALEIDGEVVGDIGGRRYRPETLGPEPDVWDFYLGYTIHPAYWGRGIATTAVATLTPALHEAGHRRIVAKVFAPNHASVRVLLKAGFQLEGTERAAVLGRDGTWLDDHTLSHWA